MSVAALVVVATGIFGLWLSSSAAIRENYRHMLIGLAQAAASQIDPVLHDSLRHPSSATERTICARSSRCGACAAP